MKVDEIDVRFERIILFQKKRPKANANRREHGGGEQDSERAKRAGHGFILEHKPGARMLFPPGPRAIIDRKAEACRAASGRPGTLHPGAGIPRQHPPSPWLVSEVPYLPPARS